MENQISDAAPDVVRSLGAWPPALVAAYTTVAVAAAATLRTRDA